MRVEPLHFHQVAIEFDVSTHFLLGSCTALTAATRRWALRLNGSTLFEFEEKMHEIIPVLDLPHANKINTAAELE